MTCIAIINAINTLLAKENIMYELLFHCRNVYWFIFSLIWLDILRGNSNIKLLWNYIQNLYSLSLIVYLTLHLTNYHIVTNNNKPFPDQLPYCYVQLYQLRNSAWLCKRIFSVIILLIHNTLYFYSFNIIHVVFLF